MISSQLYKSFLRGRAPFAVSYAAALGALLLVALYCALNIWSVFAERASLAHTLSQFTSRERSTGHKVRSHSEGLYLKAISAEIAQAELLKYVSKQIAADSGKIISSSVEDPSGHSSEPEIRVRTQFEISNDQLQTLLYDIESAVPFLFVSKLVVRSEQRPNTQDVLHADMTVSGLWRGPRK